MDNVPTHFVHVKKEAEAVSPLTYRKSDASVSSVSEHSIGDDALKTNNSLMTTQPSTCVGSALFATLTSSTPDSTSARSSTQVFFYTYKNLKVRRFLNTTIKRNSGEASAV